MARLEGSFDALMLARPIPMQPIQFLKQECPQLWELLNQRAKRELPPGIAAYLSGPNREEGQEQLRRANARVASLIAKTSANVVGDTYRRDLSGVQNENALAELLCEVTLADALADISNEAPILRPKTRDRRSCDVSIIVGETALHGDSKRLEDRFDGNRSIMKPLSGKPPHSSWPRAMELASKLHPAFKQFPEAAVSVLFLFHPSWGESCLYITQALFGEVSVVTSTPILQDDGLFALNEWQDISALAYTHVDQSGILSVRRIWKNPNAKISLPAHVETSLASAR